MARMTFIEAFDRATGPTTAVHFLAGETYDVPDELVAEITAQGAATVAPTTAPVAPAPLG